MYHHLYSLSSLIAPVSFWYRTTNIMNQLYSRCDDDDELPDHFQYMCVVIEVITVKIMITHVLEVITVKIMITHVFEVITVNIMITHVLHSQFDGKCMFN